MQREELGDFFKLLKIFVRTQEYYVSEMEYVLAFVYFDKGMFCLLD